MSAAKDAGFALDPRIAASTLEWRDWSLSQVRLMNDRRFPWLLLVPRRAKAVEWHALAPEDQVGLHQETMLAACALAAVFPARKINIGALGNVVPQLHVHVLARQPGDAAWPGPVWGAGTAEAYGPGEAEALLARLATVLEEST
ncbi:HIT family protein [Mycobacterium sp. KBS0706]|uniref:HIT domain-containing protein n=1 Tax=Mycobacterium sp. KBS0706 TaxID=2578109 RepID=UPI00110FD2D3|nr:HIT family protein [Mycobacterium sp. KBS0706]TSD88822.1 HIT family protein [Mycobacterium sp. KBS0706]